jgi:hypothetical protein
MVNSGIHNIPEIYQVCTLNISVSGPYRHCVVTRPKNWTLARTGIFIAVGLLKPWLPPLNPAATIYV